MRVCPACGAGHDNADWRCTACGYRPEWSGRIPLLAPALASGEQGFDPAQFAMLAKLELDNFWFQGRSRLIAWALKRYFPAAQSLFEVGCGTGAVLHHLRTLAPGLRLTGGDAALPALTIAADRLGRGAELAQLDICRPPFRDRFDVVGAFDVIEHLDDDAAAVRGIAAAARPGGGVMVTVPQHPWLWSRADAMAKHRRRYRAGEVEKLLAACGLRAIRSTSFISTLLPVMALARFNSRRSHDPVAELSPGRLANRLLRLGFLMDRAAIRLGVPLPVGGSRLVVAVRPA